MLISLQVAIFRDEKDSAPTQITFGLNEMHPLQGILVQLIRDQLDIITANASATTVRQIGFLPAQGKGGEAIPKKEEEHG